MPHRSVTLVLVFLGALAVMMPTSARALLQLGDPAPPLSIAQWIQGEPAGPHEAILVIEFWSPDCPHCRQSVPMLNFLQQSHPGKVVVVGITEAEPEAIRAFLAEAEEPVVYRIARDADGKTEKAYTEGFGVSGVPHAFVVDTLGRIVWQGHPMDGLDRALDEMAAGNYDLEGRLARATAEKLLPVYDYLAQRTRETDLLRRLGNRIADHAWNDARLLHRFARRIAFNPDIEAPDLALALRAVRRACELDSGSDPELEKTHDELRRRMGSRTGGRGPEPAAALGKKPASTD